VLNVNFFIIKHTLLRARFHFLSLQKSGEQACQELLNRELALKDELILARKEIAGRDQCCTCVAGQPKERKNKQCVTLYERLSKKGKPEKVIKVAIAHKLVCQIFGVIKSGTAFSKEYA
jgi:hypothetical protein